MQQNNTVNDFLNAALPASQSGHLLAIGEHHNTSEHIKFLRKNLDKLKNEHNIKTIGVELPPIFNVLFWAYRDKKLPVPEGQERAYITLLLKSYANNCKNGNAEEKANLLLDAIDKGIDIVAFDARFSFLEVFKNQILVMGVLRKHPSIQQTMRNNPDFINQENAMRNGAFEQLYKDYPNTRNLPDNSIMADFRISATLLEIENIRKQHPEYIKKSIDIDRMQTAFKKQTKAMDSASADLLKYITKNTSGNILTISGERHISGRMTPTLNTDGRFTEYLNKQGWNTTPVTMLGKNDFFKYMPEYKNEFQKGPAPALSSQPSNLLVLGNHEHNHVLLNNLHLGFSPKDKLNEIEDYVSKHLNLFASTAEHVEEDKKSVLMGARAYLFHTIKENLLPDDSISDKEINLRKEIIRSTCNNETTFTDVLHATQLALKHIKELTNIDQKKKAIYIKILEQYSGYLEDYAGKGQENWKNSITSKSLQNTHIEI